MVGGGFCGGGGIDEPKIENKADRAWGIKMGWEDTADDSACFPGEGGRERTSELLV